MSANPLLDGNLTIAVGGHDFTAYLLPGLRFSTTNPGGFGDCQFRIEAASPWAAFVADGHTMAKGDAVTITHSSTTLYEGAITNDVSHAVVEDGTAYYDVTAAGLWWKAGQKKDFCRVWGDDDYGQWFTLGDNAQSFQVDTDGKLEIRLEKGQNAKANKGASLYYWLDSGLGDTAAAASAVVFVVNADVGAANWYARIYGSDSPWGSWTTLKTWNNTTATNVATYAADAGTYQAFKLTLYSSSDVASVSDDRYVTLTDVSVITDMVSNVSISSISVASPSVVTTVFNHGLKIGDRVRVENSNSSAIIDGWRTVASVPDTDQLTFAGTNVTGSSGDAGTITWSVRVDEAMSDIAQSTNLATSDDLQSGGIGNVNWGLNIRPHMSRAEAIEYLAGTHSEPIDYGFWDSATFYCQERVSPGGTAHYWLNASDPGVDFNVFKDTESSPTHVKVLYKTRDHATYPDGTLSAVYRPSAPTWGDASVVLDVWDEWADLSLTEAQAQNIGDQILSWLDDNQYTGTITVAAPTMEVNGGGTKTTAYIRAGEYICESNLFLAYTIAPFMVTSTDVDVDSGVCTFGIGETREEFVARITPPRLAPRDHDGGHQRSSGPAGKPMKFRWK